MRLKVVILISVSMLLASCGQESGSSSFSVDSSISESSSLKSWNQGPDALDADMPTTKNPQGIYNDLGKMRASQNKKGLPQQGEANLLVVPVQFKGDDDYKYDFDTGDTNVLEKTYFSYKGSSKALGSVSNYYRESSFNKLDLDGVVSPIVTMEEDVLEYIYDSLYFGVDHTIKKITDYVYNYLFVETQTYNPEDFDSDDDGKIDGIVLAYSWYPCEAYYEMDMYDYVSTLFTSKACFGEDIDLESAVNSVAWTSARTADLTGYSYDSHIAINLVGKMMGIEDYSDTTGDLEGYVRAPLAHRDMMDGYIGDHNPFTKYQLGWIEPTKVVASDIDDSEEFTITPFEEDGDVLMLSPETTGMYGEYLMVEYYSGTGIDGQDSFSKYPYNPLYQSTYTTSGIRVYKVDARLVEGTSADDVSMADGNPDFDKEITLKNGKKTKAYYDYAFSNSGTNEYSDSGVYEDYPLVEELSKNGFNRHMTDTTFALSDDDLFLEGDSFGTDGDIDGFYTNFAFDGNGNGETKLGLTFTVDSIKKDEAKITVRRAK